ncbi:hypothetical protein JCM33374_g1468 [Metschnikowia sp. JCM 33374]|nr:hypothetical protein JCM33374_g1468 [Metschnikowia sp. JCM 33374]
MAVSLPFGSRSNRSLSSSCSSKSLATSTVPFDFPRYLSISFTRRATVAFEAVSFALKVESLFCKFCQYKSPDSNPVISGSNSFYVVQFNRLHRWWMVPHGVRL